MSPDGQTSRKAMHTKEILDSQEGLQSLSSSAAILGDENRKLKKNDKACAENLICGLAREFKIQSLQIDSSQNNAMRTILIHYP